MHFVLIFLAAQLVGALAALFYFPAVPAHLFPEIALALVGYAAMVALVFVTYVLLASDGDVRHLPAEQPLHDGRGLAVELDEQERQNARFFAHEFCLRHFGLAHSVMLSVSKESRWIPPALRKH